MNSIGTGGLQYLGNPLALLRSYALIQSRFGAINQGNDGEVLAVASFYLLYDINNNFSSTFQTASAVSVLTLIPGTR